MPAAARPFSVDDLLRYMGCAHAMQLSLKEAPSPTKDQTCLSVMKACRDNVERIENPHLIGSNWQVSLARLEKGASGYIPIVKAQGDITSKEVITLVLAYQILRQAKIATAQYGRILDEENLSQDLRISEFSHYVTAACDSFEEFVRHRPQTSPLPCAACDSCQWQARCKAQWQAEDSLYALQGLSSRQIKKLHAAGITTRAALAANRSALRGISEKSRQKLTAKARLAQDPSGYELLPPEAGKGFALLPKADENDLFHEPPHPENPHSVESLKRFFDSLRARLTEAPDAHIYLYGPETLTGLKDLVSQTGEGEAYLDRLLRERRFVDLAAVVRGAIVTGIAEQNIDNMSIFYDAGQNKLKSLRDWLLTIRPDGAWPAPPPEAAEKENEEEADSQSLRAIIEAAPLDEPRKSLLFNLSQFHKRELKPAQWAVFDSLSQEEDMLLENLDALAGAEAISGIESDKRSFVRRYRYPFQETKLRAGKKVTLAQEGGTIAALTVEAINPRQREITLKAGPGKSHLLQDRLNLHPDWPLDTKIIAQALREVIEDQCGAKRFCAIDDLLARRPPKLRDWQLGSLVDPVTDVTKAALALDQSVLAIQGPPGTGKTYVTARAIIALAARGARIGISSNSHEAIRNLMLGCLAAQKEMLQSQHFEMIHKVSSGDDGYEPDCEIERTTDNRRAEAGGTIVGGTAFFFARPENIQAFDYLIVDEAGQVGLATLTAMARAAKNLILVGDPLQLPQVIQGSHPSPADLSCLEWLLGEDNILPPERGIFLPQSRRMHPKICSYISEHIYEGQLQSHPLAANRAVISADLPQAGAFWVAVPHEGNVQSAPEEIAAICAMIERLRNAQWQESDGTQRKIEASDIIVVAPYNAQVNALRDALPADIRVGTVDKFQGQEAAVCLVSMTGSSTEDLARGMEFLLSPNRLNVAISRAKALALVFGAPKLRQSSCQNLDEMRLVNRLCALPQLNI